MNVRESRPELEAKLETAEATYAGLGEWTIPTLKRMIKALKEEENAIQHSRSRGDSHSGS